MKSYFLGWELQIVESLWITCIPVRQGDNTEKHLWLKMPPPQKKYRPGQLHLLHPPCFATAPNVATIAFYGCYSDD